MKTKVQIMASELTRKDKDIELLTLKLQQIHGNGSANPIQSTSSNIFESFLVSQLKKQNREQKGELEQKEQLVDKLKKDMKLSRQGELEAEMQQYVDECMRLRGLLEQAYATQQQLGKYAHSQQTPFPQPIAPED